MVLKETNVRKFNLFDVKVSGTQLQEDPKNRQNTVTTKDTSRAY